MLKMRHWSQPSERLFFKFKLARLFEKGRK
jgi:hypothetical protein